VLRDDAVLCEMSVRGEGSAPTLHLLLLTMMMRMILPLLPTHAHSALRYDGQWQTNKFHGQGKCVRPASPVALVLHAYHH